MISTRRIAAAVGLAAGLTVLAVPTASAAVPAIGGMGPIDADDTLNAVTRAGLPAEQQSAVPTVTDQLTGLQQLNNLNQLEQLVAPVAPVFNLLPI
ncbi:hypothetical protein GCM10010358_47770 [Streptomyces minutiscleroticus]|uniref:Secreted protein n=1 Tax=Streptomyces minutiscleroticus TaxID=68238 RepID=A0A918NQN7_9ACTN|nr:hypothetical protein [Streptomyces minutiscleroticus]GGX88150.1 hypothetical protein GCM10010358_47770 [Streptomyces minutiscleroticus]